jgi:Uma2 family endonuclease
MTIMTKTKKKTYADYAKLPEGAPIQLINGEFVESPAPTITHQTVIKVLFRAADELERQGKGTAFFAPVDVYLGETETYQPDVVFISSSRSAIIGEKKIEGAPDIVMEILSPSTAYYDLRHKKQVYGETGVLEYWIVDPMERTVEVYTNRDGEFCMAEEMQCGRRVKADRPGKHSVKSTIHPELRFDCPHLFGL